MTSAEIREKFLKFMESKGHTIVPSASLLPTDPSVLFTTAGMQQFKPYYMGEESPFGKNVTSVQKCVRTSDIDEVGDESHLTFFEMLGNFSFGEYFKKEAIGYAYEFITKELGLEIDYVTIFEDGSEKDGESEKIWKEIDREIKIKKSGRKDNFWGPTGDEGPCGPTTEIYINGLEVWNLVFNEYYKNKNGNYEKLKTPGVDTGMGLERIAMVIQGKNNVYETDLFQEPFHYFSFFGRAGRIIADHLRSSIFLIADGVEPSSKRAGYVLRRLISRIVVISKIDSVPIELLNDKIERAIEYYDFYEELKNNKDKIIREINKEINRVEKRIEKGLKEFLKKYPEMKAQILEHGKPYNVHIIKTVSVEDAFYFHQTYGLTIDIIKYLAKKGGHIVDEDIFNEEMKKHQELSRTASVGMFKGGLADAGEQTTKYHTATHLLLAALRQILGNHVEQKGSNITTERMRFDFSHSQKMTAEEIQKVENLVNEKIQEDLPIICEEMSLEEAKIKGATGIFEQKYGERVKVYTIGPVRDGHAFSAEICGGPHVDRTGLLGKFKIVKEEASAAGVRRIKAVLE